MSTDERYNGYANRETWAAAAMLNNDRATQDEARTIAEAAFAAAIEECAQPGDVIAELSGPEGVRRYAFRCAGDALSEWMDDLAESVREGTADRDTRWLVLEIGSGWRVDWEHVARSVLPEDVS